MRNNALHLDGETRSACDLTKAGEHRYFEDPTHDVWCVAYAFGNDEPRLWLPGQPCPGSIIEHIMEEGRVYAWNVAFERSMWRTQLQAKYGWPEIETEQLFCTMAEALAMNLPAKLDKAAPALGLKTVKDDYGHRVMMQLCKPRKLRKGEACPVCLEKTCREHGPYWWKDADKLEALYSYCLQDVRTEQAIADKILPLRPNEQKIFFLDAKINDRGVFIDQALCKATQKIVDGAVAKIDRQLKAVTQNAVSSITNTTQLAQWLTERGVATASVAKDVIEDLLIRDDLPPDCRHALELRQEGGKSSVAKLGSMLKRVQKDGRMRGNLQYHGAGPGRWAARGTQLQNLTRPVILTEQPGEKLTAEELEARINEALATVAYGSVPLVEIMYDKPMQLCSDLVRPMICAPKDHVLYAADFSNIEGRGNAWQAGQEDKLEAFRAFDRGEGPDLYLVAAAGIFGCPVYDAKPFRQIGKVAELACGYQGGVPAFAKMAKTYGLKIGDHYNVIVDAASVEDHEKAMETYNKNGRGTGTGFNERTYIAAEIVKSAWRKRNHKIVDSWYMLEDAAIEAMENPGKVVNAGVVKYRYVKPFLFCGLPIGRAICYPFPRLEEAKTPWGEMRQKILYKSINQFTRKWEDKSFYGGLACENITQAMARDVMAESMLRTENAGYYNVLSVHDEVIAETAKDFGSLEEFISLMEETSPWAEGFPIVAAGWRGTRYRKG